MTLFKELTVQRSQYIYIYIFGVDGISIWLIILTALLIPCCVLISFQSIKFLIKEFFLCLFFLEELLIGVFTVLTSPQLKGLKLPMARSLGFGLYLTKASLCQLVFTTSLFINFNLPNNSLTNPLFKRYDKYCLLVSN